MTNCSLCALLETCKIVTAERVKSGYVCDMFSELSQPALYARLDLISDFGIEALTRLTIDYAARHKKRRRTRRARRKL